MVDTAILNPRDLVLFGISFIATFLSISLALKSTSKESKIYAGSIPILVIGIISSLVIRDPTLLFGLILVAAMSFYFGYQDEKKAMTPISQLLSQILIVITAVVTGWTIRYVTNPIGEDVINLQSVTFLGFHIPGDFIALIWLLLLINSLNWFDGIDGLAPSVSATSLIFISVISMLPSIQDPFTLRLALIGAGAMVAFTIWNWSPAKILLGTSGVWFISSFIGMVAIIGGGKIVTTLLILAIPVIDMCLVIAQRVIKKQPPWQGDKEHHLHYQLSKLGFSPSIISVLAISITSLLGITTLSLQTTSKAILLILVGLIMTALIILLWLSRRFEAQ